MAAALLSNRPLTESIPDAEKSLVLEDQTVIACAFPPDDVVPLTLAEAYLYGCPMPFASLAESLGASTVESMFSSFWVNQPATLAGFVPVLSADVTPTPTSESTESTTAAHDRLVRNVLGQGTQTISPLNMALIASAVCHEGNAPLPRTLLAIRPPNAEWQPVAVEGVPQSYLAASTAHRLADLMTTDMLSDVMVTPQPQYPLGGQAGIASSGQGKMLSWFIGFVILPDTTCTAVSIVLEDVDNPRAAAQIGQTVLMAAYDQQAKP
jgi:peptidoglycan glycosyltransferase